MQSGKSIAWLASAGLLCGCSVLPTLNEKRAAADAAAIADDVPAAWAAAPKISRTAATGWLADFSSPRLRQLVDAAIAKNRDLKIAAAKVEQARAQARIAGADLLPQVSGDFSGSRSQRASGQRFVGIGQRSNRFELAADVNWELDFWGRIRDERGAALADAEAASADFHAARLSIAANTVKAAVTLAEAEAQIRLSQENVSIRATHLGVLEKQLARGLDPDRSALDVSLSRADLARAEATLASRKRDADEARRSLEILLGGYPAGKESGIASLPAVQRAVPAGLPSELLLRRPDMLAAEQRLRSALKSESAARKAFLPSFRITSNTGYSSEELSSMLRPESLVWTLAGSVAQTLFQGGRIQANVDLAKARYAEALEQYAADALAAFKEVETALAAEGFLIEQENALRQAAIEAERARKLALGQYEKGLAEALTLLDSQQRLFDAQSALISVKALRLRNRAGLHLAIGGEF